MIRFFLFIIALLCWVPLRAQQVQGFVLQNNNPVPYISVQVKGSTLGTQTNEKGYFELKNVPAGRHTLRITGVGYVPKEQAIDLTARPLHLSIELEEDTYLLNQVTVTATLKERTLSDSPAPIEILSPTLFKKAATTNLFDALNLVNGVRPQINCNVCNTGDIHINGMEGGYTMVMIDGMPIVSGLSTVYGLFGIPNSLVERIEVMKGPSSTLYGSEAVGGLINVITKKTAHAPRFGFDISSTSYLENNIDLAAKWQVGKATGLISGNWFGMNNRVDVNQDNFTDVTLQQRGSVFSKWSWQRPENREFTLALRGIYEDRFGGEMQWRPHHRGGAERYGESIYTKRYEVLGNYQLPVRGQRIKLQFSHNWHDQNSAYGATMYLARQRISFGQLLWDKKLTPRHDALLGVALRYTYYDDNTPVTRSGDTNTPSKIWLPGIFVQDEFKVSSKNTLLAGLRYDYNSAHGHILSPRINWKFSPSRETAFRLSYGNGFRVVNLFSEDHAAYSGSREVVIANELKPERSHNANLQATHLLTHRSGYINLEGSLFYTYFRNKIQADYDLNDNQVVFDNLKGYGISRGVSVNADASFLSGWKAMAGATFMDVFQMRTNGPQTGRIWQVHTPKFTANAVVSYTFPKSGLMLDYTANVYSPMRLPVLANDFRPDLSPWFSLHNIQVSKRFSNGLQVYGGIKNIGNFLPQNPLMRPFDPFDKNVSNRDPQSVYYNPNAYTFDAGYNYAPMQGIRGFAGVRWSIF